MATEFVSVFLKKLRTEDQDALDFFEVNPFSYLQLEFQSVNLMGKTSEGFLDELSRAVDIPLLSGIRLKFCVRVKLFETINGLSIVANLLKCQKLGKEVFEILEKKGRKSLWSSLRYKRLLSLESKLKKKLRVAILKYVAQSRQENITKEDASYRCRPLDSQYVFLGLQKMISENENPVMSFLCAAPSLRNETQDIFAYIVL